jgi:hypothetical protein
MVEEKLGRRTGHSPEDSCEDDVKVTSPDVDGFNF